MTTLGTTAARKLAAVGDPLPATAHLTGEAGLPASREIRIAMAVQGTTTAANKGTNEDHRGQVKFGAFEHVDRLRFLTGRGTLRVNSADRTVRIKMFAISFRTRA